jgi:zinc transporter ZupT
LHLFPQAFDIDDDKKRAYFWRTFTIFGGIYMFYCIEMLLKVITTLKSKDKRMRASLQREEDKDIFSGVPQVTYKSPNIDAQHSETFEMQRNRSNSTNQREALLNSTREQLAQSLSTVNVVTPISSVQLPDNKSDQISQIPSKENFVPAVALRREDQNSNPTMNIDTVAWMTGLAFLNFIDGLSIGAAFDRNILAGISISVAVMLEEVANRLGTFAILIKAGMKMRQSFLYIFLSACACYPGLALGIFLGDQLEEASPYIFALAGKLSFIYHLYCYHILFHSIFCNIDVFNFQTYWFISRK